MLYYLILRSKSLKYRLYLKAESALFRVESILEVHLDTRSKECRLINRSAQFLPTSFFAICDAKFCIICLEGGSPLAQRPLIYCTSSDSWVGLSSWWF